MVSNDSRTRTSLNNERGSFPVISQRGTHPPLDFAAEAPGIKGFGGEPQGRAEKSKDRRRQQQQREERRARAEAAFQAVLANDGLRLSSPYKRAVRHSLDVHPSLLQKPGSPPLFKPRGRSSPPDLPAKHSNALPMLPQLDRNGGAVNQQLSSRSSPPTTRRREPHPPHAAGRRSRPIAGDDIKEEITVASVAASAATGAGGVQEALKYAYAPIGGPNSHGAGPARIRHRRRKRKIIANAAACLSEARYRDASQTYLSLLTDNPEDDRMKHGFQEATLEMKYQEPERWARWPFSDGSGKAARVRMGQIPGRLPPPRAQDITMASALIIWDESPPSDFVGGYELEVSEVNALTGPEKWKRVHRAKEWKKLLKPLGRELNGLRARVRAYNASGRGEWSAPSDMIRLTKMEKKEKTEIEEIPGAWLHMDLAGIPDLKEDINPIVLMQTKQELLRALHENRTVIKIIFRYYALAGVTQVDDDPSTMTLIQFGNFCQGARIIDKKLSVSDSDRIFLRAVRTLPTQAANPGPAEGGDPNLSLAAVAKKTGIKVSKWKPVRAAVGIGALITKGQNLMNQTQFVAALIRIADARYPQPELSLGDKVTRICQDNLNKHALQELKLINDDFNERFRSRSLHAALVKHETQLRELYEAYSKADVSTTAAKRAMSTMNVIECHDMLEDAGVFDDAFGVRELLSAFVRVNIEDDLYYQEDANDTSSELVYEEFEEIIARVFFEAVWMRLMAGSSTADLLDQDGDGDMDDDDVDDLFNECDEDNSGTVTLEELTVALERRLNAAAAKLFADKLMKIADDDGSGTMDRDELAHAVRKMREDSAGGKERPGDMERAFESWLQSSFLPPAIKAAHKKKLIKVEEGPSSAKAKV